MACVTQGCAHGATPAVGTHDRDTKPSQPKCFKRPSAACRLGVGIFDRSEMMKVSKKRSQGGFTLVEMSVVLLVIGLIIGAVSIGKDMQRNAEYVKIKQKFVDQWVNAYNSHYVKAGVVIGDSQVAPRMMVNGAAYTASEGAPVSGGDMSAAIEPGEICQIGAASSGNVLHLEMDRHGVRMPPGRAEGSEDRYVYLDSNGNPQEIRVCFKWNRPSTPSGSGNMMVIYGLTPDLARALDQMIDGKPDAREGAFRQFAVVDGSGAAPGVEWDADNRDKYGEEGSVNSNRDEQQIAVVTAHYKMNQ